MNPVHTEPTMMEFERELARAGLSRPAHEEPINIVDYASAVWQRRKLVLAVFLLAVAAAALYSAIAPKVYEATTALLSPKEEGGSSMLSGLMASGVVPALGLSLGGGSSNRDMLIGVLKSKTIARTMVTRFDLRKRYEVAYDQDAVKKLQEEMTKIDVTKEGVISITVSDWDPKLAAEMAKFLVSEVNRVVTTYGTSEAGRQRVFVGEQLVTAKRELQKAEEALRRFQERNQAIVLGDQTRGAIEGAARLKGEVIASEVQLQVLRSFATDANPDVIALRRRIDEMKRQLTMVQYGNGPGEKNPDFHVPFTKVPEVGLELIRLMRDVKIQETVLTLLTQQFEQSRISEAKDLPMVQILDAATPPEKHARPKLIINVAIAGALGLVFAVMLALFLDYIAKLRRMRPAA